MTSDRTPARRLWLWWPLGGLLAGMTVVAVTAAVLMAIDELVLDYFAGVESDMILAAGFIGAVWGGTGGLGAGVLGAPVAWLVEQGDESRTEVAYRWIASVIAVPLAAAFCVFWTAGGYDVAPVGFVVWLAVPVVVVAVASWWTGGWIWRRSHRLCPAA